MGFVSKSVIKMHNLIKGQKILFLFCLELITWSPLLLWSPFLSKYAIFMNSFVFIVIYIIIIVRVKR